jgi:hypothetical protein
MKNAVFHAGMDGAMQVPQDVSADIMSTLVSSILCWNDAINAGFAVNIEFRSSLPNNFVMKEK